MAGVEREPKKVEPDYNPAHNGKELSAKNFEDDAGRKEIGMHPQVETQDAGFNEASKMKRGKQPKVFDNNGGDSKAAGAGVIDHNPEYGPITYGF